MKYKSIGTDGVASLGAGGTATFDFSSKGYGNAVIISAESSGLIKLTEDGTVPTGSVVLTEGPGVHVVNPSGHTEWVIFDEYTDTFSIRSISATTNCMVELVDLDIPGRGSSNTVVTAS